MGGNVWVTCVKPNANLMHAIVEELILSTELLDKMPELSNSKKKIGATIGKMGV